ncbi:YqjF family protein [Halegenticoccus tardaugens]|uniref:YqjF family protein n=1 Tax=Halegenticoccus tardaugens TaxID=2071624 RepID=UPI00100AD252|nr:DUF2071 domain-containing protein [Halegenticoccus tardaugens]
MLDRALVSMTWRDVRFAHWRVSPEAIRPHLPDALVAATYDGDAWLSVVALVMTDVRPRGSPIGRTFPQVNLRTYVEPRSGGERGLYFLSLDAGDPIGAAVVRRSFSLPCYAAESRAVRLDDAVRFASRRTTRDAPPARFDATSRPTGEAFEPEPGSRDAFLAETYRSYVERGGRLYRFEVRHASWSLTPATLDVHSNTLFEAAGVERPDGSPLVHAAEPRDVVAGWIGRAD